MSREELDKIRQDAAGWHIASESDSMDWGGFTAWLEADLRHAAAYDEISLTDGAVLELAADPAHRAFTETPAVVQAPGRVRRFRWVGAGAGAAMAASLAALLIVPQLRTAPGQVYATSDAAREIVLADGSTIALAPHSRLEVSGADQQQMVLAGGALFDIRHDPRRQLAINAGGLTISDIGTRFDVQSEGTNLRVAVAQGKVAVSGDALDKPVPLDAGKALTFDGKAGVSQVASVDAKAVGAWRDGRLTYDNVALPLVAADLGRYAGTRVTVSDAVRDRRFSGTLTVGNGDEAIRDLAQLLGLRLSGRPGDWRLE